MARAPFADWRRLPGDEPPIKARTFIFHTMVGTLPGVDVYFRSGRSGGIESHFGVGGPWEGVEYDGVCWQWRDTAEQADANLHANDFALSAETSDGGDPRHPWSAAQVEMLVRLARWARATHGIPARVCRTWDDAGFGWHAMWGAPSPWTPSAGKTCPGPVRINQLKTVVLPRIFADHDPTDPEEDLMAGEAQQILDELASLRRDLTVFGTHGLEETVENFASRQRETQDKIDALAAAVGKRLDAIEELLTTPPAGP
jgi:hypothetical protein